MEISDHDVLINGKSWLIFQCYTGKEHMRVSKKQNLTTMKTTILAVL